MVSAQQSKPMKASTIKLSRCACIVLALALAAALPVTSFAQDTQKGGAKQLELSNVGKSIKTAADMENVQPGDQIVMSCPKCKDVTVTTVTMAGKGAFEKKTTSTQHLCPGCTTALESVGHGKAKTDIVVHKCSKCGSEDAFCCVVKKGTGSTKGMEK
jgi:hypothetical protein